LRDKRNVVAAQCVFELLEKGRRFVRISVDDSLDYTRPGVENDVKAATHDDLPTTGLTWIRILSWSRNDPCLRVENPQRSCSEASHRARRYMAGRCVENNVVAIFYDDLVFCLGFEHLGLCQEAYYPGAEEEKTLDPV
jgi:hypothetical protein